MNNITEAAFLKRYFLVLLGLVLAGCLLAVPYTAWWLRSSGDVAVERAVATQSKGNFAVFGSGVSQDFVDYKLSSTPRSNLKLPPWAPRASCSFAGPTFASLF